MDLMKSLDYFVFMKNKAVWKKQLLSQPHFNEVKIAVLCGSTFGIIQEFLELYLLYYGIKSDFFIGQYDRFFEEAVFDNSELECFKPDIILLHVTNKNLLLSKNYSLDQSAAQMLEQDKAKFDKIWENISSRYNCVIIQNNFELFQYRIIGNAARTSVDGDLRYVDDMNRHISDAVAKNKNLYLNDINYLSAKIGFSQWFDAKSWYLYKYAINMSATPLYALNTANIVKAIYGGNKKAIVTDLDNTLWGGVIGEVGADNIKQGFDTPQGEAFSHLQKYLKYLSKHGILLNVCSKNEYEVALEGFRVPAAVLKEQDFIKIQANWKNKPENIQEIAKDINILSDAFVFLDDSTIECESVRSLCPNILTLQVKEPSQAMADLDVLSPFEGVGSSAEDLTRAQLYQSEMQRKDSKEEYISYDDYLASLATRCHIDELNEKNIERTVQLLNKTNQFNLLSNRYTIEQYKELNTDSKTKTLVARLSDKFGGMGIISVLTIYLLDDETAFIHDWVMSCRVFERKVENILLFKALQLCEQYNIKNLVGVYIPTVKNKKIVNLYSDFGFHKLQEESECKEKILKKLLGIGTISSRIEQSAVWICDTINYTKSVVYTPLISLEE